MGQKAPGYGRADRPAGPAMPVYHSSVRLLTDGCLFGPGSIQKVDRTPVLKILAAQDRQKKIVQK